MATVARSLDEVVEGPSVVTIGVFDGVHRGHQQIVARAVERARERDVRAVAVTFDPHPTSVVRPELAPPLLQTVEDRVAVLADQGVDEVLVLPFTTALSQLSPEDFVARVLAGPLGAVHVVVGENFRFGHRAAGDGQVLADLGPEHGFDADVVTLLGEGDQVLSSTAVRAALESGDVAAAAAMLGRPWMLPGTVVRGEGRGRTIGVPTANVDAPEGLVRPGGGVYAGRATRGDDTWGCVVNVGTRPTFEGTSTTVEAHLLDAELDLYGQVLRVAFVGRIRDERRFDGPEELVAQIHRDVEAGRSLLA